MSCNGSLKKSPHRSASAGEESSGLCSGGLSAKMPLIFVPAERALIHEAS